MLVDEVVAMAGPGGTRVQLIYTFVVEMKFVPARYTSSKTEPIAPVLGASEVTAGGAAVTIVTVAVPF